jgi:hypothetical protein
VPELIALAGTARPLEKYPVFETETTRPLDIVALRIWLRTVFR